MEILIPGLILVGFMIWASTRIKRNAAKAFEREEIETQGFSITKPEGFLAPVDPPDGLLFSAHSKDFGSEEAERIRCASAELSRFDDAHFDEICERVKTDSIRIISEQRGVIGERRSTIIVAERSEHDVEVETSYRIVAGDQAVYQLAVTVLLGHKEEYSSKVDLFLSSFNLK
ncbi:MAG: hypothetical protein HOP17_14085 [Acidobacteria bacterium]|nr:hypothetical protein [Acidobacteriota bacterium]